LIVLAGGDGTLSLAATELAGKAPALGILPSGTANDFARSLGIPDVLEEAAALIAAGHLREVDVGLADGRPFLNAASIGLSVAVTRRLTQGLKRWAGKLAYPLAAGREALSTRPFRVHLRIDGEHRALRAFQVVVGNGRYHGAGTLLAPDARLDDGKLHVYAILAGPQPEDARSNGFGRRWRWLTLLARATLSLRGRRPRDPRQVLTLSGRDVRVEAGRPRRLNVDGEMWGRTPVHFGVWPRALRVLAP
jgi:YegS/Rv2252/BmrU family lipid kinase